jgi:hypothetical protein
MYSTRRSCKIRMKLEFSRQMFKKALKYEINDNSSCGS